MFVLVDIKNRKQNIFFSLLPRFFAIKSASTVPQSETGNMLKPLKMD